VYGLTIQRDSPFETTIPVGYADDMVGYITDPAAYQNEEYAAIVVPKLIGLPPWKPDTGRQLTAAMLQLLSALK
jgi:neutral ceramidase